MDGVGSGAPRGAEECREGGSPRRWAEVGVGKQAGCRGSHRTSGAISML